VVNREILSLILKTFNLGYRPQRGRMPLFFSPDQRETQVCVLVGCQDAELMWSEEELSTVVYHGTRRKKTV
jgi:hypothetical protein